MQTLIMQRSPQAMRLLVVTIVIVSLVACITTVLAPLSLSHASPLAYVPPASNRVDVNLDTTWRFYKGDAAGAQAPSFNDAGWQTIDLPHTWNNLDGQDGGNNYYRGIGWYRRHLTPDATYSGRKLFLQFDGANIVTDVYVNGTLVGEHKGGFAAFRYDVTGNLVVGADNVIAVKVNNAANADIPPLSADFTFFGGLYRHVHLLVTDRLALTAMDYGSSGVYLKQTNVSAASANLQITAKVANAYPAAKTATVKSTIVDAAGNVVQTLTSNQTLAANSNSDVVQSTTLSNPHLWNGLPDPYLYKVYVEVIDGTATTDVVSQPLGLRFFSADHDQGFFLNGRYLDLHGVNKHQDRLNKGWAISEADMDQDFALMMEIGATTVRLAHYQHAQHEYDLADQDGLVIWAEIPLVNKITASTAFTQNAEQQMIELIRQNYNHPSIIFWGIANEITLQSGPDPNALLSDLANLVKIEDPTRLSTIASNTSDTSTTSYYTDVTGYNKYFGWYNGTMNDFAPWADGIHNNASLSTKKIGVSEYGAGASINRHSSTPTNQDHTEEYQNLYHETHWKAMEARPFLWGKYVWNMFDFAADGRNEGDAAGRNDKGLATYDRQTRKDAFYWYKANWSSEPVVYITSRRFNPRPSATITVKVYSNMDSVQLKLNGVSLGTKTSTDQIFTWTNVTLANGANTVDAIGTKGATTTTDSVVWNYGSGTTTPPPDGNLALNRPVTFSNQQAGNEAAKAVDGDTTTRWAGSPWPQWIQVDLGTTYSINRTELMPYASRAYQYRIEVSTNGTTYTTAIDKTANTTGSATLVDSFTAVQARYVRLTVTGCSGYTGGWASFYEFRIYGSPPPTTPPPTTPPPTTPPPTTPPPGGNLALNKPVTFSNQQAGNEASKAVDGSTTTRWAGSPWPQWIQVDLQGVYSLNRTELMPYASRAYQYRIEVSTDGMNYTTVVDKTTNTTGGVTLADSFSPVSARYVRLTVTGASGYTGGWVSFYEFRVYGG